ncbi:MAG TPA: hypothetical protein ENJ57_00445 [Rhizobiales bacterium]|nr:hypothetical protein [Hyphomicrobiales bacterium]
MPDTGLITLVLLPAGLGLLGFIEPCTMGAHLVFLGTLENKSPARKLLSTLIFTLARLFIAGLFGIFAALLGQALIGAQKGFWLIFGVIYLILGLTYLLGKAGRLKHRVKLAPDAWRKLKHPAILGLAFGLNIPACAAPILFALIGIAATTGNMLTGFVTMAIFALALSSPLLLIAAIPKLATWLDAISHKLRNMHRVLGVIFMGLGIWAIWFGLYVNPADWAGQ